MSKLINLKTYIAEQIEGEIREKIKKSESDRDYLRQIATENEWNKLNNKEIGADIRVKNAIRRRIIKNVNKYWKPEVDLLERAENAKKVRSISIVVEWKRSRMWGNNPTATAGIDLEYINYLGQKDYSYEEYTGTASGCGYDKESAAIATALNQSVDLRAMMLVKKDSNMDKKNRELFGYGSGYGIIPAFEGGVGANSLMGILKGLGATITENHTGKHSDFYMIRFL